MDDDRYDRASNDIARILLTFEPRDRGGVLGKALNYVDELRIKPQRATNRECARCGKPFDRRSWNQRFCSLSCSRDDAAEKRLVLAVRHFEERVRARGQTPETAEREGASRPGPRT